MKKWQYHNLCLPSFKDAKTLRHWHIEQGLPCLRCRQKHASVVLDKLGASRVTKIAAADSLSLAKMLASHVASTRPIVLSQRPCIAPFRPAVQVRYLCNGRLENSARPTLTTKHCLGAGTGGSRAGGLQSSSSRGRGSRHRRCSAKGRHCSSQI